MTLLDPHSINTAVTFAGVPMSSPLTVASGTFGVGKEFQDFSDLSLLGAITTKGVSPVAWPGNEGARIAETRGGMLNSIGLQNPGVAHFIEHELVWLRENARQTNVIVNVCGHEVDEFARVVEALEEHEGVDIYELNISCPNVDNGGMSFGVDPAIAASVIERVRPLTKKPLLAKLTPNVTDITEIALAVEAAGVDGISLINTVLGMKIDAHRFKAVLQRKVGGLSGPAIKPIALRMVYEVAQCVSVPLIGIGGVETGEDVVEFMLAGATMVALGTTLFKDPLAIERVSKEFCAFCSEHDVSAASDLIGALR